MIGLEGYKVENALHSILCSVKSKGNKENVGKGEGAAMYGNGQLN
jgi:hypothetical protein